jgi:hypothetical protein
VFLLVSNITVSTCDEQEENIFSTEIFIIATLMGVDMLQLGFASTKVTIFCHLASLA